MDDFGDADATRLDGNVAAGLLATVFGSEVSSVKSTCAGCGATGAIGSLLAYGLEMGAILRCPHCDTAILRVGVTRSAFWLDMRGAALLRFEARA
jgi:hypothetical protein